MLNYGIDLRSGSGAVPPRVRRAHRVPAGGPGADDAYRRLLDQYAVRKAFAVHDLVYQDAVYSYFPHHIDKGQCNGRRSFGIVMFRPVNQEIMR
ncbi:MAG: hypothetical protein HY083_04040 [Gammaproteobacteria bacterium]|nr:hypothetical protein [Gammaproteobacteria bacterium]